MLLRPARQVSLAHGFESRERAELTQSGTVGRIRTLSCAVSDRVCKQCHWFKKTQERVYLLYFAGKTTTLYKLHLGEVVVTQPTVGSNVEELIYKNIRFEVSFPLLPLNSHLFIYMCDSGCFCYAMAVFQQISEGLKRYLAGRWGLQRPISYVLK